MPTKEQASTGATLERFVQGSATHLHHFFGCHPALRDGIEGRIFRVWADRKSTRLNSSHMA